MEMKLRQIAKYVKMGTAFSVIFIIETIMLFMASREVLPSEHQGEMITLYRTGFYCTLAGSIVLCSITAFAYFKYKKFMQSSKDEGDRRDDSNK